jgi:hypothetical protein
MVAAVVAVAATLAAAEAEAEAPGGPVTGIATSAVILTSPRGGSAANAVPPRLLALILAMREESVAANAVATLAAAMAAGAATLAAAAAAVMAAMSALAIGTISLFGST